MAAKTKITEKDLKRKTKRVNLTFTIEEFDLLSIISESKGIEHTTCAKSILIPEINRIAKNLLIKEKYIPKTQRGLNLFS